MACPFSNPRNLFDDLTTARETPSIEYSEKLGGYVISRYDDIVSVLENPSVFSSRPTVPDFPPQVKQIFANKVPERGTLLAYDNPDHDRLRKSVASFFVPRRLERFEPLLRATAHDLIDGFVEKGCVDIKSNFALPLPLRTIVIVAGLDPSRWQWIGRCLSLFGGITQTNEQLSIEQRVQDVLDLHEYVAQVIQERKADRRDDLISHIWNERDTVVVEMTDYEHLSMIPGLLLAGHETTTNLLSMGISHLLHHDLWRTATKDVESRKTAIEELLRYESAITGMERLVKQESKIGDHTVQPGEKLFVAYNSGSRDTTKFDNPDKLDFGRQHKHQHLGFGRGIHACLGAPFARLLLRTELAVLKERLPNLRLKTPYEEIQYCKVHAGRGPERVEIQWDVPSLDEMRVNAGQANVNSTIRASAKTEELEMVVRNVEKVTERIIRLTLCPKDGEKVPKWSPGSHIDVQAGTIGYRQYSICSKPSDDQHIQIAVLRENDTGASNWIHQNTISGSRMLIRGPRNHFSLEFGPRKTIFIAGGIGITPIIPMAEAAKEAGVDYFILYLGRSKNGLAFVNELIEEHGDRFTLWVSQDQGRKRFDLKSFLQQEYLSDLRVYCCGPEALLTGVEEALADAPPGVLRLERFAAHNAGNEKPNTSFDVVLARSNKVLRIPEDKSVLEVINEAGAGVLSTCNTGVCGTCEVRVLDGLVDHRDVVLTHSEKAEGKSMMPCVSRCLGKKLTLDLW
ncbi:cytochrome P450 monooxygenase [Fusarium pseudocircinatum]|uniref:Cytochrome P450 monooxygenase n=1 Tax=Fusarium pseudocircinatum TaxID=56676 RepID=A0A8H5KUM8_9HYPO|nr:cytochrome P450 monooxygenase [Fusarium pseudocircinatum]